MCYIPLTTNNKHQYWFPIFSSDSILNTYIVHDLNGLYAFTASTYMNKIQQYKNGNYTHLLLMCYTARNVIHAYIALVHLQIQYLTIFLKQLYQYTQANVKLRLSCSVTLHVHLCMYVVSTLLNQWSITCIQQQSFQFKAFVNSINIYFLLKLKFKQKLCKYNTNQLALHVAIRAPQIIISHHAAFLAICTTCTSCVQQ